MSDISTTSNKVTGYNSGSYTDRGTAIVKGSGGLDKNAFLQILVAELSNLDPTADVDSTQYVTQLAQFSSMEQMSNLNATMSNSSAYSIVGKGVTLSITDSEGNPYSGIVKGVSGNNGSDYTLSVLVNEKGENKYIDVSMKYVETVLDAGDSSLAPLNSMNTNIAMMTASSYIGKYVELISSKEDGATEKISGKVLTAIRDNGQINLKVELSNGEIKEYNYNSVIKVQDAPIV
ncbi:MAG: flagellar biosynthesis protein FlgD [Clostridium sp.]|nr:flagellar biosynthesis protein FlgD [Clostridium sp.]